MHPTTPATQELKQHVLQSVELLKTLRDEIRLELHLAGMDARDEWKKLEKQYAVVESMAAEASQATKNAVDDALYSFRVFRAAITGKRP